ncbi:MAG: dihydrodipicolinate synthase family protein [Anaerolineae bacterium]
MITGVFNILATPFGADRAVDFDSLRRLVNFQLERGAYGLTILGVLGEAAKLSIEERKQVAEAVFNTVAGRVPIVVGASHPEVATSIRLAQEAVSMGAVGVMLHPPRMSPVGQPPEDSDAKVTDFYRQIAAALPESASIVVQDLPTVNDISMSADLIATLGEMIPQVRYLKLEDPPLMLKVRAVKRKSAKVKVFGGLGGMFFLEELAAGADGTMTGFAFTEVLVAVFHAWQAGDHDKATGIFDQYLPLIRFENQPMINLSIRKMLLKMRGVIDDARLREPFAPIDEETRSECAWMLKRVGISDPTQGLAF